MNNKNYTSYKNNLIFESLISKPIKNSFYGLSREHIELILGIKIPMLLESIDFKLEDKILREQYLFEAWVQSLKTAAGTAAGAVKGAVVGTATAAATAVKDVAKSVLGKVQDTAGILKALGLIIQYPTLVKELGQSLSAQVTKYLNPSLSFLGTAIKWLKDKKQKVLASIRSSFNGAHNTITGLLQKFRALSGWQKVALGAGLAILGAWVWNKIGPKVEALKKKIESAIGEKNIEAAKDTKGAAEFAKDTTGNAAAAARTGGARAAAGAGTASIANKVLGAGIDKAKEELTELGKQLLPELLELAKSVITKLGGAATLATLSAFTGPIGPFLLSVAGIVGNANLIVTTLAPITNGFIEKYNQLMGKNPHMGISDRGASLGQSTTQKAAGAIGRAAGAVRGVVGLKEQKVLLSNLLYT